MHLAWLRLLHAYFEKTDVDFWYRETNGRYKKVNGQKQSWELRKCVSCMFPDNSDPVRCNLEFFIEIRDRIEHRYQHALAQEVGGKSQALVLNYEHQLRDLFGDDEGLAGELRFPIFLSSLTKDAVTATARLATQLPSGVRTMIRAFDSSLADEVQGDSRYDFRLLLVPQTGPKTEADAAISFVRAEDLSPQGVEALKNLYTIVRNKEVPVQNLGSYKPSDVCTQVEQAIEFKFGTSHHARCWKFFNIRPSAGNPKPSQTDERYCVYDDPHRDYLYSDAWIKKLSKELAKEDRFKEIVGSKPRQIEDTEKLSFRHSGFDLLGSY